MLPSLHNALQVLGMTLLHFLWQGMVLGVLFLAAMRLLRNASAQARYACAVAALVVLFLLPFATGWWLLTQATTTAAGGWSAAAPGAWGEPGIIVEGVSKVPPDLMLMVVCAWLAGVVLLTARMVVDARYVSWLKHTADTRVPLELSLAMRRFCAQLELSSKRIRLGITPQVSTALVVGWVKPMILLPVAVIGRLPTNQIELILAHELAHIRRHDPIVNLFQIVVETVLFYHPVVRLVSNRIRTERENCTDDLVVGISGDSLSYARALTALEELRGAGVRLSIGVVDGDFARRIRRLFQEPRRQHGVLSAGLASMLAVVLMLVANAAAWQWQRWHDSTSPSSPDEVRNEQTNPTGQPIFVQPDPAPADQLPPAPWPSRGSLATAGEAPPGAAGRSLAAVVADRNDPLTIPHGLAPAVNQVESPTVAGSSTTARPEPSEPSVAQSHAPPSVRAQAGADGAVPELDLDTALAYLPEALPAPQLQPGQSDPILGGGRLVRMQAPVYPARARLQGIEAEVRASFIIGADGRPRDIELIDLDDDIHGFGRAALRALQRSRFEPVTLNGQRVERRVEQVLDFSLTGEPECGPVTGTRIGSHRTHGC